MESLEPYFSPELDDIRSGTREASDHQLEYVLDMDLDT
jgi:hypothetical protein